MGLLSRAAAWKAMERIFSLKVSLPRCLVEGGLEELRAVIGLSSFGCVPDSLGHQLLY
jgi:hypothetical protein